MMKSGTEKNPNPHEPTLRKFQAGRAVHVGKGYVGLRNGQIIRVDTIEQREFERWQRQSLREGHL